jgi:phosphatidylglycerophosphatase A
MSDKYVLDANARRALLATPGGWIACGFGSGLVPKAQGTMGSLVALLPWLLLRQLPVPVYLLVIVAGFAVGIWACNVAGRAIGVADHRSVVWDEFIGQWLALLPALLAPWWTVILGFVLFRIFDVAKPWPISWLDRRIKGGLGVMLDDVVAGLFAAIVLAFVLHFS